MKFNKKRVGIGLMLVVSALLIGYNIKYNSRISVVVNSTQEPSGLSNGYINDVFPAHYPNVNYTETSYFYGISMNPTITTGNTILMKEYKNETLQEGQIICYMESKEKKICHRIVSIYPDRIITQGDNNINSENINKSIITDLVVGVLFT